MKNLLAFALTGLCFNAALATPPLQSIRLEAEKPARENLIDLTTVDGTYSKDSGPDWASVTAAGTLYAAPSIDDVGFHSLVVTVDAGTSSKTLSLSLSVFTTKWNFVMFAAPWCDKCNAELPKINAGLNTLVRDHRDKMVSRVSVETGETPYDRPTRKSAELYGKDLGLDFTMVADAWQWKRYKQYFPAGFTLPAAAIVDPQGKTRLAFDAKTFAAKDIVDKVGALITGPVAENDILWVVDNSGSMHDSQVAIINNSDRFIDNFTTRGVEWKMGIVTTDLTAKPALGFDAPFTSLTPNATALFKAAIRSIGLMGNPEEKPFDAVVYALGFGTFSRPTARLSVILVTDAPEQSRNTTADQFLDFLKVRKGALANVTVYGVLAATDLCPFDSGQEVYTYAGSKYETVINATRGKVYKLCSDDFGGDLAKISADISTR